MSREATAIQDMMAGAMGESVPAKEAAQTPPAPNPNPNPPAPPIPTPLPQVPPTPQAPPAPPIPTKPAENKTGSESPAAQSGTPAATPAAAAAAATPATPGTPAATPAADSIDYDSKFLSERLGGRFKSTDELTAALKRHDELEKDSKSTIKPANDFIRLMNEAVSKGIPMDKYLSVQSIDFKTTPEMERMAKALELKTGFSPADALFMVEKKYKTASYKTEDEMLAAGVAPEDVREAQLSMKMDLIEADKFLKTHIAEVMTPPAEVKSLKAQDRVAAFADEIPKIAQKFAKMEFSTEYKEGEAIHKSSSTVTVSDETLREIPKFVQDIVSDIEDFDMNDPKQREDLEGVVRQMVLFKEFPKIHAQIVRETRNEERLKEIAARSNASGGERKEGAPVDGTAGAPKSFIDMMTERLTGKK